MKLKKAIGAIALIAILICGIYAAGIMYQSGSTYDGSKTDVIALYENPQEYDVSNPDGVADIIVKNNLDKTVSHTWLQASSLTSVVTIPWARASSWSPPLPAPWSSCAR